MALNRYLTNPTAQNPSHWLQCLRCLQVAHISVTEDNWWAHFTTANQHAATMRITILNTTIHNFSTKALHHVDMVHIKAWDQIVTWVITANPPWLTQTLISSNGSTARLHTLRQMQK
jgi:hypothetical protein